VIDTRDGTSKYQPIYTRRRRMCKGGHRFTTIEVPVIRSGQGGHNLISTTETAHTEATNRAVVSALYRLAYQIKKSGILNYQRKHAR
jgi:ketosteroid isomerase-like protein